MKVLIVDDESPARQEMRQLLSQHREVEVVGEAADVDTALALTRDHRPDLCFLDIRLAGESGFDYAVRIGADGPRIVFVTAYDKHAIRAFECNALDYLLKPVHPDRLAQSMLRLLPPPAQSAMESDFVFFKGSPTSKFVPWSEVRRVASQGNYTIVHLADGSSTMVLRTLKQWTDLAPKGHFLQAHRTILIRRADIREIRLVTASLRDLILVDGVVVPVGRTYWPRIQETWGHGLR